MIQTVVVMTFRVLLRRTGNPYVVYRHTLRLKSIRPFADFSYKFEIFAWSKMGVKVNENSPFLQNMLECVRYHSSRDLEPSFSVLLKIQAFKIRSFQFYSIKLPFFGNFKFEGLYF